MNNIALIINTISTNSDIWEMFFKQLQKHAPHELFDKKYVFVDKSDKELPPGYEVVYYDTDTKYQEQFTSCIGDVSEKYCVYISEDYILYENIRADLIKEYSTILDNNPTISFIRFMKGGIVDVGFPPYRHYKDLFELSNVLPYFYTNQAALWRTRDLEKIHHDGPNLHIGNEDWENSFEFQATKTCQELGIKGLYCYYNEKKRGLYHYDTIVFPHISTALIKGKWNVSEYPVELGELLKVYNIDTSTRGEV